MKIGGICPECLATVEMDVVVSPGSKFLPRVWCACTGEMGAVTMTAFFDAPTHVELREIG